MTSRSSIFSFNTLKVKLGVPKSVLLAIAAVVAFEAGARALNSTGHLEEDMSLRKTLVRRIEQIKKEKPPVWILGNSTLDWGIDEPLLGKLLGEPVIKLAHGSATLNSSAAMLDFYVNQTGQTPKRVIVTLTKDDVNPNGYRAERSQTYLDLARTNELPEGDYMMLRRGRSNIRDAAVESVEKLRPGHAERSAKAKKVEPYKGKPLTNKNTFEMSLLTKFEVSAAWFAELKQACDRHKLPAPVIVLMPTTDQYSSFHDQFVESPKYDKVHEQILAAAEANGIKVIDYWTPMTDRDYEKFRDPYHLNPDGAIWFTDKVAEQLKLQ